jgi:hypothetical protein
MELPMMLRLFLLTLTVAVTSTAGLTAEVPAGSADVLQPFVNRQERDQRNKGLSRGPVPAQELRKMV